MEVILITSGKGGTGKTTFTANAANILAQKGYKSCIIDLDFGLGKIDLLLGLESKIEFDISHVLNKKQDILNSIVKDKNNDNLFILASPKSNESLTINHQNIKEILSVLEKDGFKYVFLDSPSGINKDNPIHYIKDLITLSLVVTNQDKMALRDADSIIRILEDTNPKRNTIQLVINKYNNPRITSKNCLKAKEIERTLDIPLLGIISQNNKHSKMINKGVLATNHVSKIKNEYIHICSGIEKQKS